MGDSDTYISKIDSSGDLTWIKQLGGNHQCEGHSIAVDTNDNVYSVGTFNQTVDFDPTSGVYTLNAVGSFDAYIQKMKPINLDIPEFDFEDGYKVYPNPTGGNLVVEFKQHHENWDVILRNSLGQIIDVKSADDNNLVDLDIIGPGGIYILEVLDANGRSSTVRVIKR